MPILSLLDNWITNSKSDTNKQLKTCTDLLLLKQNKYLLSQKQNNNIKCVGGTIVYVDLIHLWWEALYKKETIVYVDLIHLWWEALYKKGTIVYVDLIHL